MTALDFFKSNKEFGKSVVQAAKKRAEERNTAQLADQVEAFAVRIAGNRKQIEFLEKQIKKDEARMDAIEDGEFDVRMEPSHPNIGMIFSRIDFHNEELNKP